MLKAKANGITVLKYIPLKELHSTGALINLMGAFVMGAIMKYIIMCGGPRSGKPLRVINNESIISRTIRLLRDNGVTDIAISTNDDRYQQYDVPILRHHNPLTWDGFCWLNTFYPIRDPACFIYGDVFYSPEAIRTIVKTDTDDIEFFASAPPFSPLYHKQWAEPFAFKVQDTGHFFDCIDKVKEMDAQHLFNRHPISWELWQVIKGTPINHVDYTNYIAINDYTLDVDTDDQAQAIENMTGDA